MNREELAWAAGFFDGEGSTALAKNRSRGKPYQKLIIGISQNDIDPLFRFQRAVGGIGHVYTRNRRTPRYGRLDYYVYQATKHEHVQAIIAMLWEFLSEPKRQQAEIAFRAQAGYRSEHPISESRRKMWETRHARYGSSGTKVARGVLAGKGGTW